MQVTSLLDALFSKHEGSFGTDTASGFNRVRRDTARDAGMVGLLLLSRLFKLTVGQPNNGATSAICWTSVVDLRPLHCLMIRDVRLLNLLVRELRIFSLTS